MYDSKDFSKMLHGERDWEEPIIKIAKSYHNGVASLYISIGNLIIIAIFSKEILETRNYLEIFQNWEISRQNRRSGGWGRSFAGRTGRNGTHLSTN